MFFAYMYDYPLVIEAHHKEFGQGILVEILLTVRH